MTRGYLPCLCVLLVLSLTGLAPAWAQQVDEVAADEARREALRRRLDAIGQAQQASDEQFKVDKKACAARTLVSGCVVDAVARRRARDEVLDRDETQARAQLRAMAARDKHHALAQALPSAEQSRDDQARRVEERQQFERKQQDLEERRAEHRLKQAREAENRKAWEAKQARAAEKKAEIEARRRGAATGAAVKASGN